MKFDLSKYSTVAERLAQFHKDYPDGRIITELVSAQGEISKTRWVVRATLFLTADDQSKNLAKATGYAFEVDGTGGANATSALENGESSAIGRCLMVAGYSMNKDPNTLASREEMQKVARQQTPRPVRNFIEEVSKLTDLDAVRLLWAEAKAAGVSATDLEWIKQHGERLQNPPSELLGDKGSPLPRTKSGTAKRG